MNRQILKRSKHDFVRPEHFVVGPVEDKHAQDDAQYVDMLGGGRHSGQTGARLPEWRD